MWEPILLSLRLAVSSTLLLLLIAVPLAYWLSVKRSWFARLVEVLVSMPLVLPPTVIGFYLLLAFSPSHPLGAWLIDHVQLRLAFSFSGLLLASVIYSLPFMMQPIKSGLMALPASYKEAAYLMGKGRWQTLFQVLLPNCRSAILTGMGLTFAHCLGEFGVVLMIGGNIPGQTRTASVAIYDAVETFQYGLANSYAAMLMGISFILLLCLYGFKRNTSENKIF